jgi:hypothetical protein
MCFAACVLAATSLAIAAPVKHIAKVDVKNGPCPVFKGTAFIYPRTKSYGDMYHLVVVNSQMTCASATAWARKMMKQRFDGAPNLPHDIDGPAGYYCHVSTDGAGHGYMGGCTMTEYDGPFSPAFSWLPGTDDY